MIARAEAVPPGARKETMQRQDQLGRAEAQLGAVDGGDANDRADAVVVNQERNQVFKQFAIAADIAEGFAQLLEAVPDD